MCIVSSLMATGIAATISSSIASAASAVGTGLASVGIGSGISAATAAGIGSTITATGIGATVGAGTGALLGTAGAAISGGDLGKGALMGAAGGAATGGVLSGAGEAISAAGGINVPTPFGDIGIGQTTSGAYNSALQSMGGVKDLAAFNPATDAVANMSVSELQAAELANQYGANVAGAGINDASVSAQIANAAPSASNGLSGTDALLAVERADQYGMSAGEAISSVTGSAATDSQVASFNNTLASYGSSGGGVAGAAEAGGAAGGFFEGLKGLNYGKLGLTAAGVGTSLYGSYIGAQTAVDTAEAEAREAEGKADQADIQAGIHDMKQNAETAAAAEEKAQLAKRRRMLVGKGKTAAASNGVMLETRAESSPAMFEQDAAAEMAYEQGKVDYNLRIKNSIHGANAALSRMSAANYREQGAYAKRLGNLKSTTSWISGIANSATGLASAFM